jgi:hypothetical protein
VQYLSEGLHREGQPQGTSQVSSCLDTEQNCQLIKQHANSDACSLTATFRHLSNELATFFPYSNEQRSDFRED